MGSAKSKGKGKAKNKSSSKGKTKAPSKAERADRYALYLKAVQAPDVDVEFFSRVFKTNFHKAAKVLREDFCGTAAICCAWAKSKNTREAYGVDLDPEPLAWGEQHNLSKLDATVRERVQLIEGDVRTAKSKKADIIAAQNFSYCIFKTRDELREYFKAARANLGTQGVFILDLFGGYEAIEDDREDITEHGKFDYIWEQERFDPVTHDCTFHISFRFDDNSELHRAFTYEWRLWTIPEVREVLLEAGFKRADVYWEGTDERSGEGTGVFRKQEYGESDPAWNAYIVGVR